MLLLASVMALLLQAAPAAGQEPVPPADVHVRLSIKDDKRTFRIGEPIELVLTFTADRPGYFVGMDVERLEQPEDTIEISAGSGVARWIDDYVRLHPPFRDVTTRTAIETSPVRVTLPLNYWFRFDEPGDFTVRVTTHRVATRLDSNHRASVVTNAVSFRLTRMSEHEEEVEATRLSTELSAMTARDEDRESDLCTALSFLAGDAGAREKVRVLAEPPRHALEQCARALQAGIYITRDPEHVRSLLESALRDLTVPVNRQVLEALTNVRMWIETPAIIADAGHDELVMRARFATRETAIEEEYFDELARDLPLRAGRSRRETASTILQILWGVHEHRSLPTAARRILIDEFDQFDANTQIELVSSHWSEIRDRSLAPALSRLLSTADRIWHGTLLGALIDVAPAEARPFVIHEIRTQTLVDVDRIRTLPDPTLPELDQLLLDRLTRTLESTDFRSKYFFEVTSALIARFSTNAILSDVRSLFDERKNTLDVHATANLLSYLDRWDQTAVGPQIERALAGADGSVLLEKLAAARYGGSILAILKSRLDSDNPGVVIDTVSVMVGHGTADTRADLEARLNRWRREWRGRESLTESTPGVPNAQGSLELVLLNAILQGQRWKVPEQDAKALIQGCLTEACRRRFR